MKNKRKRPVVYAFIDSQNLSLGTNKNIYKDKKRTYQGWGLVYKPTVKDNYGKPKGNVDAELVLYSAAQEFANYDKAVIVSGDGDFYCLHNYLRKKKKLLSIIIPNAKSESSLLKKFQKYKTFIVFEKEKLGLESKKA